MKILWKKKLEKLKKNIIKKSNHKMHGCMKIIVYLKKNNNFNKLFSKLNNKLFINLYNKNLLLLIKKIFMLM